MATKNQQQSIVSEKMKIKQISIKRRMIYPYHQIPHSKNRQNQAIGREIGMVVMTAWRKINWVEK